MGRWQGQADPPLSEEGFAQAALAGDRLSGWEPFDLVVSSDLLRARQTAEILADAAGFGGDLVTEPGLREYDVAAWSGLTREEIVERWPDEFDRFARGDLRAPPGGEDRDVFDARVSDATQRIARVASDKGALRVLMVAHGGVIRSMARLHDVAEYRATQLAGYHAEVLDDAIVPTDPVDLLEADQAAPGEIGDEGVVDGAFAL
jgi:probable phosphoglycerate mutase